MRLGLGFDPRRRYLTGPPPGSPSAVYRKRRLLAAFDPRVRYLRGLGDDSFPSLGPSPVEDLSDTVNPYTTAQYALDQASLPLLNAPAAGPNETGVGVVPGLLPAGSSLPYTYSLFQTPSTAASMANATATPSSATSWFSQINPTLGVSNGLLVGGIGAIAALVLLLPSGRKR